MLETYTQRMQNFSIAILFVGFCELFVHTHVLLIPRFRLIVALRGIVHCFKIWNCLCFLLGLYFFLFIFFYFDDPLSIWGFMYTLSKSVHYLCTHTAIGYANTHQQSLQVNCKIYSNQIFWGLLSLLAYYNLQMLLFGW